MSRLFCDKNRHLAIYGKKVCTSGYMEGLMFKLVYGIITQCVKNFLLKD